jgi:hypothetical protein
MLEKTGCGSGFWIGPNPINYPSVDPFSYFSLTGLRYCNSMLSVSCSIPVVIFFNERVDLKLG